MKTNRMLVFLLGATLTVVALGADAGAGDEDLDQNQEDRRLVTETCAGSVVVARPTADGCAPAGPGWTLQPPFPGELAAENHLRRYCTYEWNRPGVPGPGDRPFGRDVTELERDCLAVAPSAPASVPTAGIPDETLAARFLEHIGALEVLPAAVGNAPPVRVAIVDGALDGATSGGPGVGRSAHGRAMGLIVARLACPPGLGSACLVEIDNVAALRLVRTPGGLRRDAHGGYFGYQSDVARGIMQAVANAPAGRRLIISLSLAWHFDFGGSDLTSPRFSVAAVYQAIRYARCKGALVVAAGGNAGDSRGSAAGPYLPGAWQRLSAPDDLACQTDFGLPDSRAGGGPLVLAAGGVDDQDQSLTNTPPRGRAPLAAPGLQVLVHDPAPPADAPPVVPLSGASTATAQAAAVMALAWAYRPALTPAQVAQKVRALAVDLGEPADFCQGPGPCENVRRLSVCRVVAEACASGRCGPAGTPPRCPSNPSRRTLPSPDFSDAPLDKCAANRGTGCTRNPRSAFIDHRRMPLVVPQPPDPESPSGGADVFSSYYLLRSNGAPAPSRLHLALPLNPTLAGHPIEPDGLWLHDDLGWAWIPLWNRIDPAQGPQQLAFDIDLHAEGITGVIRSARVDFIHRLSGPSGAPVTQVRSQLISITSGTSAPADPVR